MYTHIVYDSFNLWFNKPAKIEVCLSLTIIYFTIIVQKVVQLNSAKSLTLARFCVSGLVLWGKPEDAEKTHLSGLVTTNQTHVRPSRESNPCHLGDKRVH